MVIIARFLARHAFPTFGTNANIIKQLLLFCAAGLLVSLLIASYGVDLSPGFF